jgi:glycine/D-amino acid oxidase-like deaminating enzyme
VDAVPSFKLDSGDVAIIGGGIIGVCAAFFLRRRGFDVVLIEREHVSFGTSGRNAGFLTLVYGTGPTFDLARASRPMYEELFIPEIGPCFEYRHSGSLIFFTTDAEARLYREFAEVRRSHGVQMEMLDREQARELAPLLPESVLGAAYCYDDAFMKSSKFVRGLASACRARGVRMHEHTAVLGLLKEGDTVVGVRTSGGDVRASNVLCATGAWTNTLLEREGVPVPIGVNRITIMETVPLAEALLPTIFAPDAMLDTEFTRSLATFDEAALLGDSEPEPDGLRFGEIFSQRADGRLQFGDAHEFPAELDHRPAAWTVRVIYDRFLERFPQFERLQINRMWAGVNPRTPERIPLVCPVDELPGLFLCAGHFAGNLEGPASAKLITELIAGDEPSFDPDAFGLPRARARITEAEAKAAASA